MQLSTRGRYAVMALVDLASLESDNGSKQPVTLAEIAERQDISLSYLEQLFAKLRKNGVVKSLRGPGGGYVLAKPANQTWLNDIIVAVNENIKVSRCGVTGGCMGNGERCNSHDLWASLGSYIEDFMANINLAMIMDGSLAESNPVGFVYSQQQTKNSVKVEIAS